MFSWASSGWCFICPDASQLWWASNLQHKATLKMPPSPCWQGQSPELILGYSGYQLTLSYISGGRKERYWQMLRSPEASLFTFPCSVRPHGRHVIDTHSIRRHIPAPEAKLAPLCGSKRMKRSNEVGFTSNGDIKETFCSTTSPSPASAKGPF